MTPLLGFAPDLEAPTPGVLVDCAQFIPYRSGMEAAPSLQTPAGVPTLAAACQGAAVLTRLDGTRRLIAGAQTALYELTGGAWDNVTRVAAYTGGSDSRWSFTQFGNTTIAANRADVLQFSNSGDFADIGSGAPRADIVFSVGAFVMALNVNDGAEKPDGWHCSAAFNANDWNESTTTQSASGRLVSTPGALTAGARLGEYAVAYKASSIYLGQYVGAPVVWDWLLVSGGEAGCVGKEALCDVDGAHFFVGSDNFWLFNGTQPVPIGDGQIRQWFFDNSDAANLFKTKCVYDRQQNRVWVFYPSAGSSVCNSAIVYHLQNKQWGRADANVQAVLNYVSAGFTIDGLNTLSGTIEGLPDIALDSQYWLSGGKALSVFNPANQLQTYTGAAGASSFTTGDAGDDDAVTLLKQIRLRFAAGAQPAAASCSTQHKMNSGDSYTGGSVSTINDGKFDVLKSARWHRATISMTGNARVTGINPTLTPAGRR